MLTPRWSRHDEIRQGVVSNELIRRWRGADETVDEIVGRPQQASHVGRIGPTAADHQRQGELLLQHRLDVHHVQVADQGPVDDHDLISLDDSCQIIANRDPDVVRSSKRTKKTNKQTNRPVVPWFIATLRSSTRLTKTHNSSCRSVFSTNSASTLKPHICSRLLRDSSTW